MKTPPPWLAALITRLADALAKLRRSIIPPQYGVLELGTMSWIAQGVTAFCELGLPDALASAPRTSGELEALGYGERERLFRLMRALAAYGVVRYTGAGRFALGRLGRALAGSESMAPMLLYANASWHTQAYFLLAHSMRENRPSFEAAHGMPLFAYLQQHPEARKRFDGAMRALTALFAYPFAAAYDFTGTEHVVDVGGGDGALLSIVLERFAHLRGTVFELPEALESVRTGARLHAVAGNVLNDTPPPADAYVLAHVLHDWDDDSCVRMLTNVRSAMHSSARVLVYEIVAPPPNNRWSQDRLTDLEMLAMLPGRERTREEYAALFERSGLRLIRVIPTGAPESILEAALGHD